MNCILNNLHQNWEKLAENFFNKETVDEKTVNDK